VEAVPNCALPPFSTLRSWAKLVNDGFPTIRQNSRPNPPAIGAFRFLATSRTLDFLALWRIRHLRHMSLLHVPPRLISIKTGASVKQPRTFHGTFILNYTSHAPSNSPSTSPQRKFQNTQILTRFVLSTNDTSEIAMHLRHDQHSTKFPSNTIYQFPFRVRSEWSYAGFTECIASSRDDRAGPDRRVCNRRWDIRNNDEIINFLTRRIRRGMSRQVLTVYAQATKLLTISHILAHFVPQTDPPQSHEAEFEMFHASRER
jgi:hypothetical protein